MPLDAQGDAPPLPAERRDPAGGIHRDTVCERAAHRRDPSRPRRGGRERDVQGRSLLPPAQGRAVLEVPPLRARREDLPLLVEHFLAQLNERHGVSVRGVTPRALRRLRQHPWRGNVRELETVLEQATIFRGGDWIAPEDLDLPPQRPTQVLGVRTMPRAKGWPRRVRCSAGCRRRCSGSPLSVAKFGAATSSRGAASPTKSRGARSQASSINGFSGVSASGGPLGTSRSRTGSR